LKVRSNPTNQLTIRLANTLAVRSVESDRFGRLFNLRVRNQNTLLVSLPALVMPDTDMTVTFVYSGRLAPQPSNQEAVALAQATPSGGARTSDQNPVPGSGTIDDMRARSDRLQGLTDESAFLRPEATFLYSNRNLWYPQPPASDYATATIKISVPADLFCQASGELTSDSPRFIAGDTP